MSDQSFWIGADVFSARIGAAVERNICVGLISHQSHDARSLQGFDPFLPGRASQSQVHFRIYSSRVHRDHVRQERRGRLRRRVRRLHGEERRKNRARRRCEEPRLYDRTRRREVRGRRGHRAHLRLWHRQAPERAQHPVRQSHGVSSRRRCGVAERQGRRGQGRAHRHALWRGRPRAESQGLPHRPGLHQRRERGWAQGHRALGALRIPVEGCEGMGKI
mmetsp:Transcript_11787/g.53200  ORF Transcript_11787/g.53200 Transcript_11787/m.53200 type:complete len:219 (-) Transcript_11787:56-712(-)